MSAKYERIKQRDLLLPAPLRWLTRAFSSITLAVCLLSIIVLFGTVASVPVAYLVTGLMYAVAMVVCVGSAVVLGYRLWRKHPDWTALKRTVLPLLLVAMGVVLAVLGWQWAAGFAASHEWFARHRATVIYRLPMFEMTELEFYSWWPMKLVLALFVLNMVWATIRRIEFKFVNIGVLTVHVGIVTIAVGSIFYGKFKVEGDMLLWRQDLGGDAVDVFYDGTTPAIYFTAGHRNLMVDLPELPRYNDYSVEPDAPGPKLSIPLHEKPRFADVLGGKLRATIPGFIAYGELSTIWEDAAKHGAEPGFHANPAIVIAMGEENDPLYSTRQTLISSIPGDRAVDHPAWALEYLVAPSDERVRDLLAPFDGEHGLVVEIPAANFRQVYAIAPGQTITAGDTGYTITVESIGPYGMSFVTRGYENATDTRAIVQVNDGKRTFRRMAMHRYPERSQDFVPAPDDPTAGPMGRRTAPSLDIKLTYLDASKPQFRVISPTLDAADKVLQLLVRLPGHEPFGGEISEGKFPIGQTGNQQVWLHIVEQMTHANRVLKPIPTAKDQRKPKDEGTYIHSLVPIDLEIDLPDQAVPWRRRIWLAHMRYPNPEYASGFNSPRTINIPTIGQVTIAFSRQRHRLPFGLTLTDFQMIPYPGSTIPRDYSSTVDIKQPDGQTVVGVTRLNNPLVYHGMKLSQTGWDPGNTRSPDNDARNEAGRYINQQRYTILGVGNNVGIRIIFIGSCMVVAGIPWAFYIKPLLLRRRKRQIQSELGLSGKKD